ncbi:hypothetical protein ILYODFUR_027694, partial [Ilyodon furcidens]
ITKKAIRTSSILIKDHPPDKKPKSDKTSLSSNEFDPTEALVVEKSGNSSVLAEGKPESCGKTFHGPIAGVTALRSWCEVANTK